MPKGTLEVQLVGAEGIKDPEIFGTSDPYALLCVGSKPAVKSFTAKDHGTRPVWNQHFTFQLDEYDKELRIRILNENTLSADDVIGVTTIPLAPVISSDKVPVQAYAVIRPSGKAQGVVKVGLSFIYKSGASYHPPAPPGPGARAGSGYNQEHTYPPPPSAYANPPRPDAGGAAYHAPPPHQGGSYPAAAYPPHPGAYPGPHPATAAPPYQVPAPYPQQPTSYPPHDQARHQAGGYPTQAGSHTQYPPAPGYGESHYPSATGYAPAHAPVPYGYPPVQNEHYTPAGYPGSGEHYG